jgi:antitoxin (DNA-binding transcriptional repressor) of toxin-antitoxin stability system
MAPVNMLQAKSSLSRLVELVESGQQREIVIARNGRPAARLVALREVPSATRLGVAKGRFKLPDSIDGSNAEVAALFGAPAVKARRPAGRATRKG